MKNIKRLMIVLVFLTFILPLHAQDDERYGLEEHLGVQMPLDVVLWDEDSNQVKLADYFDKPVLLSFVYYRCPGLCTPVMEGMAEVIDLMQLKAGKDYEVVTISVDERETPDLAKQKKENYKSSLQKKEAAKAWHFLTADSAAIQKLTSTAGWKFKREGEDIVHGAAIMLLTPEGKISQYFYGTYYLPMHLNLAILDAWEEKTAPTRVKVLKYCYNYLPPSNPVTRGTIIFFGLFIVLGTLSLLIWLIIRKKQRA